MRTPASIARHPIHPMLVAVPIGLWTFSLACDVIHALGGDAQTWQTAALLSLVGGLVGALLAAVPGFVDMLSLRGYVKRVALVHMAINLVVVGLYAVNAWLRSTGAPATTTTWLSAVGIALLLVSGWLGGKMVYVHGVAVASEAQPAPSASARSAPFPPA